MKKIFLVALMISVGCSHIMHNPPIGEQAEGSIINNKGDVIGKVQYVQGNEGVLITINAHHLTSGKHGMHFHTVGTCEDHQHFKNAKGHIMPTGKPHGFLHPKGPHEGNLPNLVVAENGTVNVELYSDLVSVNGRGGKPALLDENGSTLIIHASPDDHNTQPIGGSGGRVACSVVVAKP